MLSLSKLDPVLAGMLQRHDTQGLLRRALLYVCLILSGALFLLPALWMISTAFKTAGEAGAIPPIWLPESPQWENFTKPFENLPFFQFYVNTFKITIVSIVGVLLSCTPVAYAFARLRFRGRDTLFVLVLATMMLPDEAKLVPLYILFSRLNWINTILPLTVPHYFAVDGFIIFLLRQFFMSIPRDLDEACRIDGGGYLTILLRIIIPLSIPVFGVVTILQFVSYWNDFFWPLIFLTSLDNYTVSLGLRLFQTRYFVQINTVMAMTLLATLPTVTLFFLGQRIWIRDVVLTGVNK